MGISFTVFYSLGSAVFSSAKSVSMTTVNDPNVPNVNDANKLNKHNFSRVWDGIAYHNARADFIVPFKAALGCVSVDGATLLEVAMRIDPGGTNGAIIATGLPLGQYNGIQQTHANPQQMQQHQTRSRRLASTILAHVVHTCDHYRTLQNEYAAFGPNAFEYLNHHIVLAFTPEKVAEMQTYWSMMTVDRLGLAYQFGTIMIFYEHVSVRASEFVPEKSHNDIKEAFLRGMPAALNAQASFFQMQTIQPQFLFPATLPPFHPQYRVGQRNLHPFAMQPDVRKIATELERVWVTLLKSGAVREKPAAKVEAMLAESCREYICNFADTCGIQLQLPMINTTDAFGVFNGEDYFEEDTANFGKGKGKGRGGRFGRGGGRGGRGQNGSFSERTRCFNCGGLGHIAVFTSSDGRVKYCATVANSIARETLNAIVYPHLSAANSAEEQIAAEEDRWQAEPVNAGASADDATANNAWWD